MTFSIGLAIGFKKDKLDPYITGAGMDYCLRLRIF